MVKNLALARFFYYLCSMKRIFAILLTLLLCSVAVAKSEPTVFAHRGCWSKNDKGEFVVPENSVAAVAMAARMGYAGIECDVKKTKDGHLVVLHDKTINRTMRNAVDYSLLTKKGACLQKHAPSFVSLC